MSGECEMCGNHTLECDCSYEMCEKCNSIKIRGDNFCIACLINQSRELIKFVDENLEKYYE
jgi:hypothetical protein